ncbi:MAG: permease, partial [Niameybacter sp.]
MANTKRGLFVKSDVDAAFGVFFDGFTKVIAGVGIMIGSIGLSSEIVFGTILPGLGLGVLILHLFTWWYGNVTAKRTNNPGIVAMPAGITAGRFFVWLSAIMLPTY